MAIPKVCIDRVRRTTRGGALEGVHLLGTLWPNGSVLKVGFRGGDAAQRALALEQAGWWSGHANLTFVLTPWDEADIRVTFDPTDGAWSYVGNVARTIPRAEATMNLGFQDGGTSAHEFGHAIGLVHEHQSPNGGLRWDEARVIADLSGPPNDWDEATIRSNVLDRYRHTEVEATDFDPSSIMLYFFPDEWTVDGHGTHQNDTLSDVDKALASRLYPKASLPGPTPLEVGGSSVSAAIGADAEEDRFTFTLPRRRRVRIETSGPTDVVLRLFGPDSATRLVGEDDDSGEGLNASLTRTLSAGTYLVSVRHYHPDQTGSYAIRVRKA